MTDQNNLTILINIVYAYNFLTRNLLHINMYIQLWNITISLNT